MTAPSDPIDPKEAEAFATAMKKHSDNQRVNASYKLALDKIQADNEALREELMAMNEYLKFLKKRDIDRYAQSLKAQPEDLFNLMKGEAMTIKELIEQLAKLDNQDLDVVVIAHAHNVSTPDGAEYRVAGLAAVNAIGKLASANTEVLVITDESGAEMISRSQKHGVITTPEAVQAAATREKHRPNPN